MAAGRWISRIGLTLGLTVLIAEIGLRFVLGNMAQTSLYTLTPKNGACVGLAPDTSVTYTGWFTKIDPVIHEVNADGYRGPAPAPGADPVVLMLGDSFIYGQGVTVEQALPARLQAALAATRPGVAVVNLGVPGFNLDETVDYTRRAAASFSPDLMVLALVHNDLEPSLCSSTGVFPPGELLRGSYAFRGGFYAYKMVGGRFFSPPEDPGVLDRGLREFGALATSLGVRAAVVVLGSPLRRLPPTELRAHLEQAGLPYLDAHAWLDPGGLPTLAGEGHLDAAGNDEAARRISAWILEKQLL